MLKENCNGKFSENGNNRIPKKHIEKKVRILLGRDEQTFFWRFVEITDYVIGKNNTMRESKMNLTKYAVRVFTQNTFQYDGPVDTENAARMDDSLGVRVWITTGLNLHGRIDAVEFVFCHSFPHDDWTFDTNCMLFYKTMGVNYGCTIGKFCLCYHCVQGFQYWQYVVTKTVIFQNLFSYTCNNKRS